MFKLNNKLVDPVSVSEQIVNALPDFMKQGTHVQIILCRKKDGGHSKEYKRRLLTLVSHNEKQYRNNLEKLLTLKNGTHESNYRIYTTVSPRNLRKAEKLFKQRMLELDFSSEENKRHFYERFNSKWISALTDNTSRDSTNFMFDIDEEYMLEKTKNELSNIGVDITFSIKTKNGYHIVTKPFNPELLTKEVSDQLQKDGMVLLKH